MGSFWSGSVGAFLATDSQAITGTLAAAQIRHFRLNEVAQLRAWEASIAMLRAALSGLPDAAGWHLLLEYPMLRLGSRPDAILLTDRAVLVLEFKAGAAACTPSDRRQVDDYAVDLHDFHTGCRQHPVVPILVAEHAPCPPATLPLILFGAAPVSDASAATLPALLRALAGIPPAAAPLCPHTWLAAPYRPVPTIVEAACLLYAKHGVADIRNARSTPPTCAPPPTRSWPRSPPPAPTTHAWSCSSPASRVRARRCAA